MQSFDEPILIAAISIMLLNGYVSEAIRLLLEYSLHSTRHRIEFVTVLLTWARKYEYVILVKFCTDWGIVCKLSSLKQIE